MTLGHDDQLTVDEDSTSDQPETHVQNHDYHKTSNKLSLNNSSPNLSSIVMSSQSSRNNNSNNSLIVANSGFYRVPPFPTVSFIHLKFCCNLSYCFDWFREFFLYLIE